MTQPDDDSTKGPEKKFTQADLDRLIDARLARERAKYADYDELKQAAAAAAGSKSQLDKMQEQLDKMAKRAEAAEAAQLRSDVANELGLTAKQARRLSGSTREELLADGRELLDDLGIKPGAKSDEQDDGAGDGDGQDDKQVAREPAKTAPRGRPKEDLRSGAPLSEPKTEELDPLKLAASVTRRF